MLARKALAGTAGAPKVYVEDVFSTYLYTGTGATNTISNSIDLSGKGGLVWTKTRGIISDHRLFDTARGALKDLRTNANFGQNTETDTLTSFNSTGFTLGADLGELVNKSSTTYASWTFRKAEKFFDVVTYTGNGSNRTISHSLGSTPGCIIVKRTDTTGDWYVYHRSNTANPETDYLLLNSTAATADLDTVWNDTAPTSTVFSVGTNSGVNANNGTYVAYLFAHDAGGFGDAGSDNVISCGSFTTDGSGNATVTLGYEPQWMMLKTTGSGGWFIRDTMRGFVCDTSGTSVLLTANTSNAESSGTGNAVTATGTQHSLAASTTYIYIAIRRGPMKTPETGTSVYNAIAYTGNDASNRQITGLGFPPDLALVKARSASGRPYAWEDRLRGADKVLVSTGTDDESSFSDFGAFGALLQDGITVGASGTTNEAPTTYIFQGMRRAPGFFDVVCYTGTGSATTVSHNLGVAPELMIIKSRSTTWNWAVYHSALGNTKFILLDSSGGPVTDSTIWNNTSPTSTNFAIGTGGYTNANTQTFVAYLFASLSGVSKVGSYTGNGSSVTVTTNFQPRFILVKRTDSTGNWIVGDSARGLPTGNDPALFLNTTAGETTGQDWVDVSSTGFTVNETALNANVNTGTYLYLAVA